MSTLPAPVSAPSPAPPPAASPSPAPAAPAARPAPLPSPLLPAAKSLPAPAPPRMTLASIRTGRLESPLRLLAYGLEGVGKSSFAADAPAPIFVCPEDGTRHLDIARFPEPESWAEV